MCPFPVHAIRFFSTCCVLQGVRNSTTLCMALPALVLLGSTILVDIDKTQVPCSSTTPIFEGDIVPTYISNNKR
jgi:hypothetical protein